MTGLLESAIDEDAIGRIVKQLDEQRLERQSRRAKAFKKAELGLRSIADVVQTLQGLLSECDLGGPAETAFISEVGISPTVSPIKPPSLTSAERTAMLIDKLASPAVREQPPAEEEEVAAKLSDEEVAQVFTDYVPGVSSFLFRGQSGVYSLKFIQNAYRCGLKAFQGTDMHNHLMWLLRLIVHQGYENKPNASRYLNDVAEAFMDCQAVQARVIERVGFTIKGLSHDFRGYLISLAAEFKSMALRMLAYEEIVKLGGPNETLDPPHYENLLLTYIGEYVGMSEADIRRAKVDEHAKKRFKPLNEEKQVAATLRFKELFDLDAMIKAMMAELNSFSEASQSGSPPLLFLEWVDEHLTQKHIVFDEDTCTKVELGDELAQAILEVVFLGSLKASPDEMYRGERTQELFHISAECMKSEVATLSLSCTALDASKTEDV